MTNTQDNSGSKGQVLEQLSRILLSDDERKDMNGISTLDLAKKLFKLVDSMSLESLAEKFSGSESENQLPPSLKGIAKDGKIVKLDFVNSDRIMKHILLEILEDIVRKEQDGNYLPENR
ncbi:MAG: hypothetical protein ACFFD4_34365 [Candidatus Odinarchaeota archaeon]